MYIRTDELSQMGGACSSCCLADECTALTSCSSLLTFSSPPMSSQLTLGTSTTWQGSRNKPHRTAQAKQRNDE